MTTARIDEIDIQPLRARTGYFFRRRLAIGRRLGSFLLLSAACITRNEPALAQNRPRTVHVFVALADNAHQGIVPVPAPLGNGEDGAKNLYWGAAFGVRTYFRKTGDWKELSHQTNLSAYILERSILYNAAGNTYLIADAYRGKEIKQAITGFFQASTGSQQRPPIALAGPDDKLIELNPSPELSVYVGHDGLMDFAIE